MLGDMGDGMPFRPGTFDAVIRYGVNTTLTNWINQEIKMYNSQYRILTMSKTCVPSPPLILNKLKSFTPVYSKL